MNMLQSLYAVKIIVQNGPSQSLTALLDPFKCIPPLSALFVFSHNGEKTAVVGAHSFMAASLPASLNPCLGLSIYEQT